MNRLRYLFGLFLFLLICGRFAVSPIFAQTVAERACKADITADGLVDLDDYSKIVVDYLKPTISNPKADITVDGIVDISDYAYLASVYLQPALNCAPTGTGSGSSTFLNLSMVTPASGRFQKIEWTFDLAKTYPNPYYSFDQGDTAALNPTTMSWVGVDGISVDMHLTAPSGKTLIVPAFWMEDYTRIKDANFSSQGNEVLGKKDNGRWHLRFTPSEVGQYQYYLTAQDKIGTARYPTNTTQAFTVTDSTKKGFIHTSTTDPRFLQYDNGQSYVPIGSGRQWWNDNVARSFDYENAFTKFGQNGVNLTRMWDQIDFGLSLEGTGQPLWLDQNTVYGAAKGIEVATQNVHGGLRSARPSVGQGWYQRLAFTELNKPHTLTVWIKTSAVSGGVAQVNIKTGTSFNSGTLLTQTTGVSGTTGWVQYTTTFTPTNSVASINLIQTAGTGVVYMDDIVVGPTDSAGKPTYNIISDADIERHFYKGNPNNDPDATPTLARPIGTYMNQWAGYEMDKIVESAEANGVAIQSCSCSGPWFTWPKNIGQTSDADWADAWVLKSWQRNFRYRVARWGYSPAILGWELMNEQGHINVNGTPNLWRFFQAYGAYQKATDPYGHLRTDSQNSQAYSPGLWSGSAMDMANYHWYLDGHMTNMDPDEHMTIYRFAWCLMDTRGTTSPYCQGLGLGDGSAWVGPNKPWVWGEIGVGLDGTQGNTGEAGARFLHNKVWAGLFSPMGTVPLEWWWYQEDATATTAKFASAKAASAFFTSVDYAHANFVYSMTTSDLIPGFTGETVGTTDTKVRVYGMRKSDKKAYYAWVVNRDYVWSKASTTPAAVTTTLTFNNLLNQSYTVETWNTSTGQILLTQQSTPVNGTLNVTVSGLSKDVALKIQTP